MNVKQYADDTLVSLIVKGLKNTVWFLTLDVGVLGVVHLLSQLLDTQSQLPGLIVQCVQVCIGGVGVTLEKVQGLLRRVQLSVEVGHQTSEETTRQ